MSADLDTAMKASGLSHLTAVSGVRLVLSVGSASVVAMLRRAALGTEAFPMRQSGEQLASEPFAQLVAIPVLVFKGFRSAWVPGLTAAGCFGSPPCC
ncbi:ComEC/Rec2 family competence protein [Pseudarthrobacter sp. R1]|uniref:ComEC/Rec2 family competence protein n=1 Tax=Pseudarthrobacter sp. R1 TaxID=2944934 RepID=UPI0035A87266